MTNFLKYIDLTKIDADVLNDIKILFNKNKHDTLYLITEELINKYLLVPKKITIKKCISLNKLTENEDYIINDNIMNMTFSSFYFCLINMKVPHINDIGYLIDSILKFNLSNQNSSESSENDELYNNMKEVINEEHISTTNSIYNEELLDNEINHIDKEITVITNEINILKDDIPIFNLNYSNTINKLDIISDNILLLLKNIENVDKTTNYIKNNTEGLVSNLNKVVMDVSHINQTYKL